MTAANAADSMLSPTTPLPHSGQCSPKHSVSTCTSGYCTEQYLPLHKPELPFSGMEIHNSQFTAIALEGNRPLSTLFVRPSPFPRPPPHLSILTYPKPRMRAAPVLQLPLLQPSTSAQAQHPQAPCCCCCCCCFCLNRQCCPLALLLLSAWLRPAVKQAQSQQKGRVSAATIGSLI